MTTGPRDLSSHVSTSAVNDRIFSQMEGGECAFHCRGSDWSYLHIWALLTFHALSDLQPVDVSTGIAEPFTTTRSPGHWSRGLDRGLDPIIRVGRFPRATSVLGITNRPFSLKRNACGEKGRFDWRFPLRAIHTVRPRGRCRIPSLLLSFAEKGVFLGASWRGFIRKS